MMCANIEGCTLQVRIDEVMSGVLLFDEVILVCLSSCASSLYCFDLYLNR